MADQRGPNLFTIALDRCFVDALAQGLIHRHGGSELSLARGMVILPNRRAAAALRDAFVRASGSALLLPRLVTLGDGDLNESAGAALDPVANPAPVPPTIDPVQRQLRLASLIGEVAPGTPVGEAFRLAQTVAQTIDQLLIEELSIDEFDALSDGEPMSSHWEKAFRMLRAILARWPSELEQLGCIDQTDARNRMLRQTAGHWRAHGLPAEFVVAAGVSTSAPAVAALLRVIALQPRGCVVFPHIDLAMPDVQWDALGDDPRKGAAGTTASAAHEAHPQFHLKLLLDRMGCRRDEVAAWPSAGAAAGPKGRAEFVGHMMTSAQFTGDWPHLRLGLRDLSGVTLYDLATPAEEALTIALAMRETLERTGQTAALVTPDRAIAARVAGHLTRWGLSADDSAGTPLSSTAAGQFLLALLAAAASEFAPVELVNLLSHPLAARDDDRRDWLDQVRKLDLALRGPRPAPGLSAVTSAIAARTQDDTDFAEWWSDVCASLSALELWHDAMALADMTASLRRCFDALTGPALWTGADGRALAQFYEGLQHHAASLTTPVDSAGALSIFRLMLDAVTVRPPQSGHPRLFIWGLIEARLQRADVMILAGLNEGQWPQRPTPDPWLAPMIRRRLGLPGVERQTGLSALDFACAFGAERVIVTRARRDAAAPTVASRLRLRIDALVREKDRDSLASGPHAGWAKMLDTPQSVVPLGRPALAVADGLRPKSLSVTEVDVLRADPFAFFARNALGLNRLHELDAEPTMAWRGTMVHDLLHAWLISGDWTVPAMDAAIGEALAQPGISPVLRTLWAPRLRAALHNFVTYIEAGRADGRQPIEELAERRSETHIHGVTLSGKPDRIDRLADGGLLIVDYKTGSSPAKKQVDAGYALQLGLLGMMAQDGAFTGQREGVSNFEYWRTNRSSAGDLGWISSPFYTLRGKKDRRMDESNFVDAAREIVSGLIATYLLGDEPFVAKLVPEFAPYADYDQFMRLEEWIAGDDALAGDGAGA